MFIKNTALLALGASAVVASPLNKRQASSAVSSAISSAASGASSAVASATSGGSSAAQSVSGSASVTDSAASTSIDVTPTSSAAMSASSALSSAAAATSTGMATGNMTNTTSPEALAFGCPEGYSLTYVIGVAPYEGVPIEQAYSALQDWGTAIPPPIESVNSTGSGEGAMRSWELSLGEANVTVDEVLTMVNETPSTFLEQQWNLSQPLMAGGVMVSNYTNVLTLYQNSTSNTTTAQIFSNFCVNNQTAGLQLYSELVRLYLSGLQTLFQNSTMSNSTLSNSTMTGAASSSAASGTSSVASSASSGASSVASGASSGASSVASAASSGASGAVGTVTNAVAGAASTALSGASSVLGVVTSAL